MSSPSSTTRMASVSFVFTKDQDTRFGTAYPRSPLGAELGIPRSRRNSCLQVQLYEPGTESVPPARWSPPYHPGRAGCLRVAARYRRAIRCPSRGCSFSPIGSARRTHFCLSTYRRQNPKKWRDCLCRRPQPDYVLQPRSAIPPHTGQSQWRSWPLVRRSTRDSRGDRRQSHRLPRRRRSRVPGFGGQQHPGGFSFSVGSRASAHPSNGGRRHGGRGVRFWIGSRVSRFDGPIAGKGPVRRRPPAKRTSARVACVAVHLKQDDFDNGRRHRRLAMPPFAGVSAYHRLDSPHIPRATTFATRLSRASRTGRRSFRAGPRSRLFQPQSLHVRLPTSVRVAPVPS